MKKIINRLFICLFALIIIVSGLTFTGSVQAQSEPPIYFPIFYFNLDRYFAFGLDGGTVENVLIDPENSNILYAGTWGNGIYKSTDAGESWTKINKGLRSGYIYEVAIDPDNSQHLLASVYEHGIDQSFDGGANWAPTDGFPSYAVAYSIDFNPVDPSIVYAAIREATIYENGVAVWWPGGVWKSTTGGDVWFDSGINNGLIEDYIYDLAIDPQHPDTIYTANHKTGVYKTTNGGVSWSNVSNNLVHRDIRGIQVDPYNSSRIYAGIWDGYGFSYSTNGGASWVSVSSTNSQDLYVYEVQVDPKHPSSVYLTTATGVYICENPSSGSVCPLVSDSGKFVFDVALDVNGPAYYNGKTQNIYTGIQYKAVHKSTDAGSSFDPSYEGIRANIIKSILIDPSDPAIQYVSSYGRGLFKTTDGGATWKALHYALSLEWINDIAFRPGANNVVYVGDQRGGVYFSGDSGETWSSGSSGISRSSSEEILPTDESETDPPQGIYDWMDPVDYEDLMAAQQTNTETRATSYPSVVALGFEKNNSAYMFAGLDGKGINYSNNYGQYWSASNITSGNATDSMVDPSLSSYYNFISMAGGGVKASSDRKNWINKNNGLNTTDVYALERIGNGIYLAGTSDGVYKTTDAASSWIQDKENNNIDGIRVTDLLLDPTDPTIIWATTYEGLYQSTDSGDNWNPYPIANLLNDNLMTIVAIPGVHEFYLGIDGGDLIPFIP